ncbi:MAG: putative unusual protein kinase regulating ubiquinone biosynthesis (AarF/ABC1/UbiB family) [Myxococcota bacterium]|jgi:predicted unusual protein kinase regulating ubiquinone biosynthesis (AarF/ABC1/UbiB family)
MNGWLIAVLVVAGTIALLVLALALTGRRSAAGIVTSRSGRTLRIHLSSLRLGFRWLRRSIHRAVTPASKREALDARFHAETAQTALDTMGNMKGALMKLGQIVSFMDETMPAVYQEQLKKLQGQAPPMDYATVAHVIRDELGDDPEMLFEHFHREPLAAASIGQVHRATLFDGTEVVVKVQYPGVDDAIRADLANGGMLMAMMGAMSPGFDAGPVIAELKERLVEELDYVQEAAHQELFGSLFAGHPTIRVPAVYRDRCSHRVLTTEYVAGRDFYDFQERATDEQRRTAVLAIYEFVFDSLFVHEVFNGDPHPGNYIFHDDGCVTFIDFGSVKRFDPEFIRQFKVLNRYYLLGDREAYYEGCQEIGFIRPGHDNQVDPDWLWEFARWFYMPVLEDAPFEFTAEYCSKALQKIFGADVRKRMNMPPDYIMLNRITFGLNSILSRLGANENWRRRAKKYYFPDEPDPLTGI